MSTQTVVKKVEVKSLLKKPSKKIKDQVLKTKIEQAKKVKIVLEVVTPKRAFQLLDKNTTRNRKLDKVNVKRYSNLMENGKWNIGDGSFIMFDERGNMVNGQTRLRSIIKSGKSQPMFIVYNIPEESFKTMDEGKIRTRANVLETYGITFESAKQAAIAKYLIDMSGSRNSAATTQSGSRDNNITNARILDFVTKHRTLDMETLIEKATQEICECFKEKKYISTHMLGAYYIAFGMVNKNKRDAFFESYKTGANLGSKSPILYLLKELQKDAESLSKLYPTTKAHMFVTAWNQFIQGLPAEKFIKNGIKRKPFSPSLGNKNKIVPDILDENGRSVQRKINERISDVILPPVVEETQLSNIAVETSNKSKKNK